MKKSEIVLYIFYLLLTNKEIRKEDIMSATDINSLTFARYLSDIRNFLVQNLNCCYEIKYRKSTSKYVLVQGM